MNRISDPKHPVAIVTGTTASGKTGISIEFALGHPEIEIVNADSLLVYRGFDIGTAKPSMEERQGIPHHLVDLLDPNENFTAGDFVRGVELAITDIHERGKRALIVGGTGFYLKALLFGLWDAPKAPPELRAKLDEATNRELFDRLMAVDEESALRISLNDRYRLVRACETLETTGKTPSMLEAEAAARGSVPGLSLFVVDRSPEELRPRIALRTRQMIAAGLLDEVRGLLARFPGARPFEAVGYAEAVAFLEGRKPAGRKIADGLQGLQNEIELATNQLAKRQRTWFHGQFKRASQVESFLLEGDRTQLLSALDGVYR
jgi:tRNA dimethylallyltransferase